jgi:hypothetical protein
MDIWCVYVFILCLCCPVFRQRPCDELIIRPRSPTVCKMIMKLNAEARAQEGCRASEKKREPWGWKVDGTGTGSFSNPGLGVGGIEPSCSVNIHSSINGSTVLCWAWPLLQWSNLFYTDGRAPWTSDQLVARPLPKHRTTQRINAHTNIHALNGIRTHHPSVRIQFMP